MERLTENKRNSDGTGVSKQSLIDRPGKGYPSNYARSIVTRLAELEDLEEQGLLLRLPCKVGDILYFAHHDRVISSEVLSVKYHVEAENHGIFIRKRLTIDVEGISAEIDFCEIGKTVFLTEAEAKLAEMEGAE